MMLEEFIFGWLETEIGAEILASPKGESISLKLSDYSQIDDWMEESVFDISAMFMAKRTSYEITKDIVTALKKLKLKNGINGVGIETVRADRVNSPAAWRYQIILRIRHRSFTDWG